MLSITARKPLNRWDYDSIRPGIVGSVGDVNMTPRLKSSLPGDFRWEAGMAGNNESRFGTKVTDGDVSQNFGMPARNQDSNWGYRDSFRTARGWIHQDMRVADRRIEPVLGSLPSYSWNNKIAQVVHANEHGKLFEVPPGGIMGGQHGIPRGGNFPRVTDRVPGDIPPVSETVNRFRAAESSFFGTQNYVRNPSRGNYGTRAWRK